MPGILPSMPRRSLRAKPRWWTSGHGAATPDVPQKTDGRAACGNPTLCPLPVLRRDHALSGLWAARLPVMPATARGLRGTVHRAATPLGASVALGCPVRARQGPRIRHATDTTRRNRLFYALAVHGDPL